jgi:hypothetical protein
MHHISTASSSSTVAGEHRRALAPMCRVPAHGQGAIVPSCPCYLGPLWTQAAPPGPCTVDPIDRIFRWKINLKSRNRCHFANKSKTNIQGDPRILENNSRYAPSHYQKLQIAPHNFVLPYLCHRNSDFGDYCAKILRITSSFILYVHLTHVCCILLIDCVCFELGNVVPKFFEGFKHQALEESQFFFVE